MSSSVFRFKQFEVHQDRTAMKIGTDGVLLGAWAKTAHPRRILDVGTGTGIIALMLAQRYPQGLIDALEIEANAAEQARYNFQLSPWHERLQLIQTDFNKFQTSDRYDLIVSNPPYFDENYLSNDAGRNLARHNSHLRLENLLKKSKNLLNPQGSIQLILPVQKEYELKQITGNINMYLKKITYVKGRKELPAKRILVQITNIPYLTQNHILVIEKARHQYTAEYITLTRDFYLKM